MWNHAILGPSQQTDIGGNVYINGLFCLLKNKLTSIGS